MRGETGVDTVRALYATREYHIERVAELRDGWRTGSIPALSLTWVEGHPSPGGLARPEEVTSALASVREQLDAQLGVIGDLGVARLDVTTTRPYDRPAEARAFLAGMASLDLPRCEAIRRGTPVHSVAWAHERGRRLLARCYDKGLERGGEAFRAVRLEDQGRFPSGRRPSVDVAADPSYQRDRFVRRFAPMRKAVDGVKAASLPVVAQAIADEVKYGYRSYREGERLAGALVLFAGGVRPTRGQSTLYRRRRELREAGFVVVEDFMEAVEVDLGDELERALEEFGA